MYDIFWRNVVHIRMRIQSNPEIRIRITDHYWLTFWLWPPISTLSVCAYRHQKSTTCARRTVVCGIYGLLSGTGRQTCIYRYSIRSVIIDWLIDKTYKASVSDYVGTRSLLPIPPYPYIRIKRVNKPQLNRDIKHVNNDIQLGLKVS